jgi:hypothetical protein
MKHLIKNTVYINITPANKKNKVKNNLKKCLQNCNKSKIQTFNKV